VPLFCPLPVPPSLNPFSTKPDCVGPLTQSLPTFGRTGFLSLSFLCSSYFLLLSILVPPQNTKALGTSPAGHCFLLGVGEHPYISFFFPCSLWAFSPVCPFLMDFSPPFLGRQLSFRAPPLSPLRTLLHYGFWIPLAADFRALF